MFGSFKVVSDQRKDNTDKQRIDIYMKRMISDEGERSQALVEKCQALKISKLAPDEVCWP